MALSQLTFGSCFEDSDLGWFGTSVLGALITGLVVFKDSDITARFFWFLDGGSRLFTSEKK